MTKIGIVGSGKYKNKKFVIEILKNTISKENDIIVSGHSPRNKKYNKHTKKYYYDNVDIWAEDWANEFCQNEPIIYPAEENTREEYFKRNKKISIDSEELKVFINKFQYQSGAWNTVKYFINKPDFNHNLLIIYDENGIKWYYDELPSWVKKAMNKIKINNESTNIDIPEWAKEVLLDEIKFIEQTIKLLEKED